MNAAKTRHATAWAFPVTPVHNFWQTLIRTSPVLMVVSAIGLIWILVIAHQASNRIKAEEAALASAATLGRALEEELLRTIGALDQTLHYVRDGYTSAPKAFRMEDFQQKGRFLSKLAFQIGMTDAKGILLSSNLGSEKPIDLSDREHIRVHLDGSEDKLFISKPVLGRISRKWAIQLSRRMEFADGSLAGVVVVSFDPGILGEFHSSVIIGNEGTITVVGDDGIVRVRSPQQENGIGRDLSRISSWKAADANPDMPYSFKHISDFDGIERLYASRRVRGTSLRIIVGQSTADIYKELGKEGFKLNIVAAVATAWLLGLLWMIVHYQRGLSAARDRAEAEGQAKARFLATMSHEIRTPLNGVIGIADVLSSTPLNDQQARLLQTLGVSANHLLGLLNDVLDLSRLEADRAEIEKANFSIRDVAQATIDLLAPNAVGKGLALELEIAPAVLPAYRGDPAKIRQILFNLIGNAVKFTEQGFVRLGVDVEQKPGDARHILRLTVEDSGCGIPEEALGKLFEDFSQVDASISRRYGGTGLGLAISQRLAVSMGGRIKVYSDVGIGSWFEVLITLDEGDADLVANLVAIPERPKAKPQQGRPVQALRILLAEDSQTNRFVISQQLGLLDQEVDVVSNGNDVLTALAHKPYDLILMDMMMPGMDGLETTRAIRMLEGPVSDIRIIALTANTSTEDEDACRMAGMDGFLTKPIGRDSLSRVIAEEVEYRRILAGEPLDNAPAGATAPGEGAPGLKASQILDLQRELGEEDARMIVDIFMGECLTQLDAMKSALGDNDRTTLKRLAHSIKGSASGLGFEKLSNLARTLESSAFTTEASALLAEIGHLDQAFSEVQAFVQEMALAS